MLLFTTCQRLKENKYVILLPSQPLTFIPAFFLLLLLRLLIFLHFIIPSNNISIPLLSPTPIQCISRLFWFFTYVKEGEKMLKKVGGRESFKIFGMVCFGLNILENRVLSSPTQIPTQNNNS